MPNELIPIPGHTGYAFCAPWPRGDEWQRYLDTLPPEQRAAVEREVATDWMLWGVAA